MTMERDPQDVYRSYEKFLNAGRFDRAYRCLKQLLSEFPKDDDLMKEIICLALLDMDDPALAKPWLLKRVRINPQCRDLLTLSEIEIRAGSLPKAREYLDMALDHQGRGQGRQDPKDAKLIAKVMRLIEDGEFEHEAKRRQGERGPSSVRRGPRGQGGEVAKAGGRPVASSVRPALKPAEASGGEGVVGDEKAAAARPAHSEILPQAPDVPSRNIAVRFTLPDAGAIEDVFRRRSTIEDCRFLSDYARLGIQKGFDELLCLGAMRDVDRYWYQVETVKKVLKHFRGRVLLCDEVGLGKTIEAGMVIKEYFMRGMVKNVLILTPAPLVSQWREEMSRKFGLEFASLDDDHPGNGDFWSKPFVIASIHTAKREGNFEKVTGIFYDMVVVDEAHHLKNSRTQGWRLVNQIQKKFILLLTATPVQNNLMELYNLITLLKPGQFKTEKLFKKEHVKRGNRMVPVHGDELRGLLKDVVIRNTRSAIDLKLPRRYASTIRAVPTDAERRVYEGLTALIREAGPAIPRRLAELLLREVGSSPHALSKTLSRLGPELNASIAPVMMALEGVTETGKGKALLDIVLKNPGEKKVVFAQYLKSMDYIASLLERRGLAFACFRGDLSSREKDEAIERFKGDVPLLVSSESGGEGRNMQFCNTLINYDLPWNPMRIEQRIGRLHRIGQARDVFIFNLATRDTIEDHLIGILDSKINMFEMVIGEIEPILGHLGEDADLGEMMMDIWMASRDSEEERTGFERLGERLVEAKSRYLEAKDLDREIFGEDYEV